MIERDVSHPCIVAWVPFNESWGVPNLPDNPAERHYVQIRVSPDEDARPHPAGDRQRRLGERGHRHHRHPRLRFRPGAHRAPLSRRRGACRSCSEGSGRAAGCSCSKASRTRTIRSCCPNSAGSPTPASRERPGATRACDSAGGARGAAYHGLLRDRPIARPAVAGFCYTQFADTYQEANGLLYADRRPKFSLAQIREATSGGSRPAEPPLTGPPDSGV